MTDFAAGMSLLVAAVFMGMRHILLAPKSTGWPPAPHFVRAAIFFLMAGMIFQGMSLTGIAFEDMAGRASPAGAMLCIALATYSIVMFINVARQYYPKAVWNRIERILTLAECKNGGLLIELTRRGIYVFMPGRKDDPEPIREADIVDLPERAI